MAGVACRWRPRWQTAPDARCDNREVRPNLPVLGEPTIALVDANEQVAARDPDTLNLRKRNGVADRAMQNPSTNPDRSNIAANQRHDRASEDQRPTDQDDAIESPGGPSPRAGILNQQPHRQATLATKSRPTTELFTILSLARTSRPALSERCSAPLWPIPRMFRLRTKQE